MHIMLFVLIMIITVSVIFIPIIHKSTVDDIAAIEAMDSNGDTFATMNLAANHGVI